MSNKQKAALATFITALVGAVEVFFGFGVPGWIVQGAILGLTLLIGYFLPAPDEKK
jgi:hypothetical protein